MFLEEKEIEVLGRDSKHEYVIWIKDHHYTIRQSPQTNVRSMLEAQGCCAIQAYAKLLQRHSDAVRTRGELLVHH